MNKKQKSYTYGNKNKLHWNKIIYETNFLKQEEKIFLNEGTKSYTSRNKK
jgi:hypothetical protein